jgi:Ca-activated chloride channel family protein
VAASSEKAAVMSQLAARYATAGRTVNGACFEVTVNSVASGTAESDLAAGWDPSADGPAPDAWTPAASTWLSLLRSDLNGKTDPLPSEAPQSVTSTPLVLAMPEPMARAMGWPDSPIGWSDVLVLANDPQGWASRGHPEWGRFALGKTNPTVSTSGLAATIGTLVAATGTSADLNMTKLQDPTVQSFLRDVDGDTTLTYLANLQRADDSGSALNYLSAVAVEEKSVLDYNAGNPSGDPGTLGQHAPPKVPLVAVYPKEGTLYSDNPYAVLNAPWSTPEKQAGAKDFLAYLSLPEQQQVFTDGNFRTADHRPGSPITASPYLTADGVKITLNPPGPQILSAVRDLWSNVRKRARVLMVLDVSGSMEESSGVGNQSKLELAKTAATAALGQLTDTDQVGLWSFSTGLPTPDGITDDLVPVAPLVDNRGRLADAISALAPLNGTPLYAATRGAVQAMQSSTDPGVINAVVILTDGHSDYANDADLGSLVQDLTGNSGLTGIRVFSIAYGADADIGVLTQISDASRAAAYDARDPASINKVFADVLSNF